MKYTKDGYTFTGWAPTPSKLVEGNATYYATWVKNNDGTISVNNSELGTNDGTITTNNSIIRINNGRIETNSVQGSIHTNNYEVEINNGTVRDNRYTVESNSSSGTVQVNRGTISGNQGIVNNNHRTIALNDVSGLIDFNHINGNVTLNNGTVTTNEGIIEQSSGTIDNNRGNISSNTGTIARNVSAVNNNSGSVINNDSNGAINSNYGTVDNNNRGSYVSENWGTVNSNNQGGVVRLNAEDHHVNINSGTVIRNYGIVDKNDKQGTVELNQQNGLVDHNTGTVISNANGGTVRNFGGKVLFNYATVIDFYRVIVDHQFEEYVDYSGLESFDSIFWVEKHNGSVRITPPEGYAPIASVGELVANDDGTYTLMSVTQDVYIGFAPEEQNSHIIQYQDGCNGDLFDTQFYIAANGTEMPVYDGLLNRQGYVFGGWDPEPSITVTDDATYTAIWYEDINDNGVADKDDPRYSVKYSDGSNGEVFSPQITEVLTGLVTPVFEGVATRDSYVFAGWNPEVAAIVTGEAVYTAIWKEDLNHNEVADEDELRYTVTYFDGSNGEVFAAQTTEVLVGLVTPEFEGELTRDNYIFAGWNPEIAATVTGEAIYTAVWKEDINRNGIADEADTRFTVTYSDGVNGEAFVSQVTEVLIGMPTPAFEGEPTRDNYIFTGWDKEISETVMQDVTYIAEWTEDFNNNGIADGEETHYNVVYTDGVNDEELFANQEYNCVAGQTTPCFEGELTKDNYVFTGWDKEIAETVTQDVTYTAVWKEDINHNGVADEDDPKCFVTYIDGVNGEVFAPQTTEVLVGVATPTFEGEPTRDNYIFAGWNPEVAATVTGEAIYTVVWKEDINGNGIADEEDTRFTVTYSDGTNGEAFVSQVTEVLVDMPTPAFEGEPTRDNYIFTGWDKEILATVTENITYTAVWVEDFNNNGIADEEDPRYSVTYSDGVNGEAFATQTTEVLVGVATPAFIGSPERTGYQFAGWSPNIEDTVSGEVIYTAVWVKGIAYAVLTDSGELVFFRSNNAYSEGTNQTVVDINDNTYTGQVYTGIETVNTSSASTVPWYDQRTSIKKVYVAEGQEIKPRSTAYWFCANSLTELDLSGFDTSKVTNMCSMFAQCSNLTELDLRCLDTSSVVNMSNMFYYCKNLTELGVSGLNTSKVTNMSYMFQGCNSLTELDLSGMDTSSVIWMSNMFYGCSSLEELDIGGFDTSKVADMSSLFYNCSSLTELDLSSLDTSAVVSMPSMFQRCSSLIELDISCFDTSNTRDMSSLFNNCRSLTALDVSSLDTSSVTNMSGMFSGCSNLEELDVSSLDTSSVTNMSGMFSGCSNLEELDLRGFDTSKVTDMSSMFNNNSNLAELDLSSFDTGEVMNMTNMFSNCNKLMKVTLGEGLNKWISNAYLPAGTWNNGSISKTETELYNQYSLNASKWAGTWICNSIAHAVLTSDGDLIFFKSNWRYSPEPNKTVTDADGNNYTGQVYTGIETLSATRTSDIPWYNQRTSIKRVYVTEGQGIEPISTAYWFYGCSNLIDVDLIGLNTDHVTDMRNMFVECSNLKELDLSGLDTSNVTNMSGLFYHCSSLAELDLRSFDTDKITDMSVLFSGCDKLTKITLGSGFTKWKNSAYLPTGTWRNGNILKTETDLYNQYPASASDWSGTWIRESDAYAVLTSAGSLIFFRSNERYASGTYRTVTDVDGNVYTGFVYTGIETLSVNQYNDIPWINQGIQITRAYVSEGQTIKPVSMQVWFYGLRSLTELDLSGFDTSNVSNMSFMFSGCDKLTKITLGEGFTKWINNAYLPTGTWSNGNISKTEVELYNQYPSNASTWAGTWVKVTPGWQKIDDEWLYINDNGTTRKNDWAKDSKGWCWMGPDGKITKDKWIKSGGEWYYLKPNGYMAANEWARDSHGWMYMDGSGKITKDKWIKYNGEWYYLKPNGYMAANEWAKDSHGWMYMNESGKITKDKWIKYNGEWYYLKPNGYMAANEWARDSHGWMYMNESGKITKDKWVQYNGEWYYLKPNGYMAANEWAKDSKGWCWLDGSGKMVTRKWVTTEGATYYIDASGHMVTGNQTIDGKEYQFSSSGTLITSSSGTGSSSSSSGGSAGYGLISASGADVTFVVNTNSAIFHYPGCSWVSRISSQNRQDVGNSYSELIDLGYDPCQVCLG